MEATEAPPEEATVAAPPPSPLTLAVAGPSASGKTTLARELCRLLQHVGCSVSLLHQDEYFTLPKAASYWTITPAHDTPAAIDMERLRSDVLAAQEAARATASSAAAAAPDDAGDGAAAPHVVIVEGFLLLQDAALMRCVDASLFLRATREACLHRRLARSERTERESEGCRKYFEDVVWPSYLRYTAPALEALLGSSVDARVLSGEESAPGFGYVAL